jgi:hypothetical protein
MGNGSPARVFWCVVCFLTVLEIAWARPTDDITAGGRLGTIDVDRVWKKRPAKVSEDSFYWQLFQDQKLSGSIMEWLKPGPAFSVAEPTRCYRVLPKYLKCEVKLGVTRRTLLKEYWDSRYIDLTIYISHPSVFDAIDMGLFDDYDVLHQLETTPLEDDRLKIHGYSVHYLNWKTGGRHRVEPSCKAIAELPLHIVIEASQTKCSSSSALSELFETFEYDNFFNKLDFRP